MKTNTTPVSGNFHLKVLQALGAILFFLITYLLLIAIALGLTAICVAGGLFMILAKPFFLTLAIGGGLMSMGVLVLIFVVKFIFKKYTIHRPDYYQITPEMEPALFDLINSVAERVKTRKPKNVFLSPEVNASVFYNSSFWSMFLPVRKNLVIGLGLINTITVSELEAILAHEFGHFSQRSMKIGSYVYNVNRIIHNMLFDNTGYTELAMKFTYLGGIVTFFVKVAMVIVKSMQEILQFVYGIINSSYTALSREMEFDADRIAASVAGADPLVNSLRRMDLANYSLHQVFQFYQERASVPVQTQNVYPQQKIVMDLEATKAKLQIIDGLPQVEAEHIHRFHKSKLVVKDQWASHQDTEDRIEAIEALHAPAVENKTAPAFTLFRMPEQIQSTMTSGLFQVDDAMKPITWFDTEMFSTEYQKWLSNTSFPPFFQGFYDQLNPVHDPDTSIDFELVYPISTLFDEQVIDRVLTKNALESDISNLEYIAQGHVKIPSFEYDGQKYDRDQSEDLARQLREELAAMEKEILEHQNKIYAAFSKLATTLGQKEEFKNQYDKYARNVIILTDNLKIVNALSDSMTFLFEQTPNEIIPVKIQEMTVIEADFKKLVHQYLDTLPADEKNELLRTTFTRYLENTWPYFSDEEYHQTALEGLGQAVVAYRQQLLDTFFSVKKDLLEFMAGLAQQQKP